MTDKQIEKIISDNMPLLDIPDSISYDAVLEKIQENSISRNKTINIRRIISIAASFLVVIVGILSLSTRYNNYKMDTETAGSVYDEEAYAPIPEPELEQKEASYDYYDNSVSSEETYMMPADGTQGAAASVAVDQEIALIVGEEKEVEIDSCFGNHSKICYYDFKGNIVEQDSIKAEIVTSENRSVIIIQAVKACNYTVVIEENNDIYKINVIVLEE